MHYPEIQHTYLAMDSQICFHRQLSYTHEDTVADKKKFPFPLRTTPFRFCSVGVPFLFTFSVVLNCVPLHTAKGGQTFNTSSLKFLMLHLNNLGIPCVQW